MAQRRRSMVLGGGGWLAVVARGGRDRSELFEDGAQPGIRVGSELVLDLSVDRCDDRGSGSHQLLAASRGTNPLRTVVIGVGHALEISALLKVVDQRLDRLFAHVRVRSHVDLAHSIRTGPLEHREVARSHVVEAGGDQIAVDPLADRLPRRAKQDPQHWGRTIG
jgi:hypothetical protein